MHAGRRRNNGSFSREINFSFRPPPHSPSPPSDSFRERDYTVRPHVSEGGLCVLFRYNTNELLAELFHSILTQPLLKRSVGLCNVAGVAWEVVACAISPVGAFIFHPPSNENVLECTNPGGPPIRDLAYGTPQISTPFPHWNIVHATMEAAIGQSPSNPFPPDGQTEYICMMR